MAYATYQDIEKRLNRTFSAEEQEQAEILLEDAALIIDSYNREAEADVKSLVSCRMVARAIGDGGSSGFPIGATQGTVSALGYSQTFTVSGGVGEVYISKHEKKLLGCGDRIGAHSPLEDM